MAKGFSIAKYAEALTPAAPAVGRDIEVITAEILEAQRVGGEATLTIGRGLIEAKGKLEHGAWLTWLSERVNYSERTAQRLMKISREWSNPTAVSDLGARKALALLALPPEERETFMEENNVIDMTSRQLEQAIRERDEARKAAEAAQTDARAAEESRAKMETDILLLKEMHQSALDEAEQAAEDLLAAQKELKKLRERPVDVAVEVDQEAVERARAEAVAEMEERVRLAETARSEAETALEEARRKLEGAGIPDAQKYPNTSEALGAIDRFESEARTLINQLHGVKLKALGRSDTRIAGEARSALLNLADYARSCAE